MGQRQELDHESAQGRSHWLWALSRVVQCLASSKGRTSAGSAVGKHPPASHSILVDVGGDSVPCAIARHSVSEELAACGLTAFYALWPPLPGQPPFPRLDRQGVCKSSVQPGRQISDTSRGLPGCG